MSWNYRIMAFPDNPKTGWEEIHLTINDVYYDEEGNPDSYGAVGDPPTFRRGEVAGGETLEDVRFALENMMKALDKPILYGGDRWPQVYTPQ